MKYDSKKLGRLRRDLPEITVENFVRDKMDGHPWYRADEMAKIHNISISTVFNWIRNGTLEACTMCSIVHCREPLIQGANKDDNHNTPTSNKRRGDQRAVTND